MTLRLAFIGFGEAARAFLGSLAEVTPVQATAYDILIHGPEAEGLRRAAESMGVRLTQSAAEAVAGAELVISAVTAAQAAEALRLPYAGPVQRQVVFDINSVTAACKAANAARVRAAGAYYLDMAVMAPVHPARHRTPVLVAGDLEPARRYLDDLGFSYEVAGQTPGEAAAVKMVRSLFVKGLEAVTVQALSAAAASGCLERVWASLNKSYPGLNLPDFAPYQFERMARHGRRRAEELREVAQTMRDLGFPAGGALAEGIADVQQAVAAARPQVSPDAGDSARAVAAALARETTGGG